MNKIIRKIFSPSNLGAVIAILIVTGATARAAIPAYKSWLIQGTNLYTTGTNVGIGTANPTNILTVVQNSATDPIADAWTTYSSKRWKENIILITGALEKVKKLQGVYFNWKETGNHDLGMIAEEVGKIIPEVVAYEENGIDAKSIDYARLTALLVEAVKQLKAENDSLKQRIEIIEASAIR